MSGAVDKTTDFDVQSVTGSQSTIDLPTLDYVAATQDFQSITSAKIPNAPFEFQAMKFWENLDAVVWRSLQSRQIRADRLVALKVM